MGAETVKVFHGTEESLVRALESGSDLFYACSPGLRTAIFSNDIRISVLHSGGLTTEREYITYWEIPLSLLSLVTSNTHGLRWYVPSLEVGVDDLESIPTEFMQKNSFLKRRGIASVATAQTAVQNGQVVFVRTPNQYYQGAEEVDKVLARFDKINRT